MVKTCILVTDGTNCHRETKHTFELAGSDAEIVHIKTLIKGYDPANPGRKEIKLDKYEILAIAGGFSHGDYISAGKIFANDLKHSLGESLEQFVKDGKPIIGICNGFQVLVKYGFLPGFDNEIKQTTTLTYNKSHNFECRPIRLTKPIGGNDLCIWTRNVDDITLPVANGEGRFESDKTICDRLFQEGLVVFQYANKQSGLPTMQFPDNPNNSMASIAGICDPTGLIFGLMPHPERYNSPENHYLAPLQKVLSKADKTDPAVQKQIQKAGMLAEKGVGIKIFENAVKYVQG